MSSTQYQVVVGNVAWFKKKEEEEEEEEEEEKQEKKKRYRKKIFASALLKISRRPTVVCY